jgi:hypothetical protein
VTREEARQKLRELTALVESFRQQAILHPDDAEAAQAWRESRRDLDLAIAALAELFGDSESAIRFRKKAQV